MSELTAHLREEEIVPYLDGRLESAERERFDAHLAACASCRGHVAELRSVMEELGDWMPADPTGSFDAVVARKLAADERNSPGGWAWMFRPGWGVALIVALLAVGSAGIWFSSPDIPGPDVVGEIVAAPEDVDNIFDAAMDSGEGLETVDSAPWLTDYELIQEFDTLFDDSGTGNSDL